MKTLLKILLVIVVLILLAIGGYFAYIYFSESGSRDTYSLVPEDAIYVIETENLTRGWKTVSSSKMWQHLISNQYFSDINEDIAEIDSLLSNNKVIDMALSNRKMLISTHKITPDDYDFIFYIDIQKASKMGVFKDALTMLDYNITKYVHNNIEVIELADRSSSDKYYLAIVENILVVSFRPDLLKNAIEQKDNHYWQTNRRFQQVATTVRGDKLFNFYFNYAKLDEFMKVFMAENNELVTALGNSLAYSAFSIDFKNERLYFDGYTNTDSVSSYLKALSQVDPDKVGAHKVFSDQTAFMVSMCFENFSDFVNRLQVEFSGNNEDEVESYTKRINQLEKALKIDIQTDFFGWIGNEISFSKLRPKENARMQDVVVAFHAKDKENAQRGMENITRQIDRRVPTLKFTSYKYKGFTVSKLNTERGFFKLLFGNLFSKLEKPYFTYLGDYVVFSNSEIALLETISDYTRGRTLSYNSGFNDFKDEFSNKTNVSVFVQMPKMYAMMYYFANREKRNSISKNRELIMSFSRIGFQLESDNGMFRNTLIMEHNEDAVLADKLDLLELEATNDVFYEDFDSSWYYVEIPEDMLLKEGEFKLYYDTAKKHLKFVGQIVGGTLNGLGKKYYKSGYIMSSINYEYATPNGFVTFYYDDNNAQRMVEANIKDGKFVGKYQEFYRNGARKSNLNFNEEGQLDGEAQYFYKSGILKMEGEYKDGMMHKKWRYYSDDGQLYNTEKYRKGVQR